MRKYYTRPCNFFYGNYAKKLILSKKALPLAGKSNIAFDKIEIFERKKKGNVKSSYCPIAELNTLEKNKLTIIKSDLKRITSRRKNFLNLKLDNTQIMGVLNITPDSFSDGGKNFKPKIAIKNAIKMYNTGANIIDIGAESTRPGAKLINPDIEIKRLKPILEGLKKKKIRISIDTRNSLTMKYAIEKGVKIINDVSALNHDPESINVIKSSKCLIVLMHMQGNPQTMQKNPKYNFAPKDIYKYLKKRINYCIDNGIKKNRIIIDPGIGFGKTSKHNIQILQNLKMLHKLSCPILVGLSRKRFISEISKNEEPLKRIPGTIAANHYALDQGANILRVHDVKEAMQAKKVWQALQK